MTGSSAANDAAAAADLIVGVGTRLQDFTTGSRSLFPGRRLVQINVQPFDAHKHGAEPVVYVRSASAAMCFCVRIPS